ncbi:murein L,D-transpeptidase catalytic domain-containing protein [Flavobacterium sp. KACC 22763]|uniref:murein L,D-transpeptidase catalytic domain-containing protein n=1 Tax=Flavobacterium sp. KACC 22763 TaxID=3025668 RepID=UPI002366E65C|nr:murein L,D-transpeptidase catalytic domain family protein [Flavobacterium sp. KACC 22763]WDF62336.1 murein L,D-transpeptidase catalytic domain family protein [Flavobacterium sp. KACC 22763]
MKIVNIIFLITACVFGNPKPKEKNAINGSEEERFNQEIENVKKMIASGAYNSKTAFFIDMRIKSGKNRFFVYDLENNTVIDEGLVANGAGSETGIKGELKFSNEPNSKCTSLGRYAIGKSYKGMFGKAYILKGLDQTNNNAVKRMIVLHSYSAVPEGEQDHYISLSQGCPMVSEVFFKRLEKIIDSSKSNIILNIYY